MWSYPVYIHTPPPSCICDRRSTTSASHFLFPLQPHAWPADLSIVAIFSIASQFYPIISPLIPSSSPITTLFSIVHPSSTPRGLFDSFFFSITALARLFFCLMPHLFFSFDFPLLGNSWLKSSPYSSFWFDQLRLMFNVCFFPVFLFFRIF